MTEVTFHDVRLSLSAPQVRTQVLHHLLLIMRSLPFQRIAFDILVQVLIGVQLRTVRRQREHTNPARVPLHPTPDRSRLMHPMPVEDQEHLPPGLSNQPP